MHFRDSVIYRVIISIGAAIAILLGTFFLPTLLQGSGFLHSTLYLIVSAPIWIPLAIAYDGAGDGLVYLIYIIEVVILAAFLFLLLSRQSRKNSTENKTQE